MSQPFLSLQDAWPRAASPDRAALGLQHWAEQAERIEDRENARLARELAAEPAGRRLLEAVFGNSPFLTRCALADVPFFVHLLSHDPEPVLSQELVGLKQELAGSGDQALVMRSLRRSKRRVALLVALADIAGLWPLERVTGTLSDFAGAALSLALSHLLLRAASREELALTRPDAPEQDCGYCVLAMGKLGAGELNYSSDIDLIVFFDPAKADYRGSRSPQEAFVRLTRDLVGLIEERTPDGYVFRTDLRLRPDPGAMPAAISYGAAMAYYESMGQNWERAAMIKARPVAGDLALGRELLAELRPFVWRKHLDFWAIQDVHSIKRQINAHRGGGVIAVGGHNIKLGRGGIREIEFFAQTQQLIYGGREPAVRCPRTVEALAALAAAKRINRGAARKLTAAYEFLRRVEHRLQMVEDQQTQTLPADDAGLERFAIFMGYDSRAAFEAELLGHMRRVEAYYAELFEEAPSLSGPGNLVFTGGEPDPDTMATLTKLGFQDGGGVFNLVRGWHHGRYRATRSTRSRELLTELMPSLLQALGKTANPDAAVAKFDEFLAGLPAGVQLFSLLAANPALLDLLAEILGGAPALAEHLSRNPGLLEAVLTPDFFAALPSRRRLDKSLQHSLAQARDFQDVLDLSRRWAADRKFQVGVNLLRHTADVDYIGRTLSNIADSVLRGLLTPVREEFERAHGTLPGPGLAVVALGKLGAREMTVSSDLDLVFLYKVPEGTGDSDGAKPLAPSLYYARLAQRFINALTALTAEGRLYTIDMRLRPSGTAGPIASSLAGFRRYHAQDAWTWEQMALTRARVVAGDPALAERINAAVRTILTRPHEPDALLVDVAAMRTRIGREFPARDLWSLKYLRGGLVDLDFLAQYLELRHAAEHPEVIAASTGTAFARLAAAGLIGGALAQRLIETTTLLRNLQNVLRLTVAERFDEAAAPDSLKASLAEAGGCADFRSLKERLIASAQMAYEAYNEIIEQPAAEAAERLTAAGCESA